MEPRTGRRPATPLTQRAAKCSRGGPVMNEEQLLRQRAVPSDGGWLAVDSQLTHFALISYALPAPVLQSLLPKGLQLIEFKIDAQPQGLISMAVFLNRGFHFTRLKLLPRLNFGQTNYRVYVTDCKGDPGIWFLGTSLGSVSYRLPHLLWQMPWYGARYHFDCVYTAGRYQHFDVRTDSAWGQAQIQLRDTGEPMALLPGFASLAQQKLLLTHPVTGYFSRRDGQTSHYSIWHPPAQLTHAEPEALYFRPLETAGLLSPEQMQRPHSVLLQPEIPYRIYLPPVLS